MLVREFLLEWRRFGIRVALYNAWFLWRHRHDAHVHALWYVKGR